MLSRRTQFAKHFHAQIGHVNIMEGLLPAVTIAGIVILILYLIGVNRKPDFSVQPFGNDEVSFTVPVPYVTAFGVVANYAQTSGLNVEQFDQASGVIVLGENLSLSKNHNGFWLPIRIKALANGHTSIHIGIQSKTYQIGIMLRPYRDNAANMLKLAFAGYSSPNIVPTPIPISGIGVPQQFKVCPSCGQHLVPSMLQCGRCAYRF